MNTEELNKTLEQLDVPNIQNSQHRQNLRRALLNSDVFNKKESFWERIRNTMNFKKLLPLGAALAVVALIITTFTLNGGNVNTKQAQAKEIVKGAIERLNTLTDDQKQSLAHDLGSDPQAILEEAYNAEDLTYEDNETFIGEDKTVLKRVGYTNAKGEKVSIDITADNVVLAVAISNPNMTLEEWLQKGQSDSQKLAEDLKKYEESIYKPGVPVDSNREILVGTTKINNDPNNGIPLGWIIYSNPAGYQIAYPQSWFTQDETEGTAYASSVYDITKEKAVNYSTAPYLLQIVVHKEGLHQRLERLGDNRSNLIDTTLNGIGVYKLDLEHSTSYFYEHNGWVVQVVYSRSDSQNITSEEANSVIGTFRLMN